MCKCDDVPFRDPCGAEDCTNLPRPRRASISNAPKNDPFEFIVGVIFAILYLSFILFGNNILDTCHTYPMSIC